MNLLYLPWLELAVLMPLFGALVLSQMRDPNRVSHWGLVFTGTTFTCTLLQWLSFYLGTPAEELERWSLQHSLFGRQFLEIDELNAPLVPAVALLHFLTAVATARTKMRRFSFAWSLACESLRLGGFGCKDPWVLIVLLSLATIPPYIELLNRRQPTRIYVLHMGAFVGLMVLGYSFIEPGAAHATQTAWATIPLMAAVLIRCGAVPVHVWLTDWFEHASFGNALLFLAPLSGVYAAVRLVLPVAPDWELQAIGLISLFTAVYASGMALVARQVRRFYAYLFLSHASLVLVGLEMVTPASLTGALCLWFSVLISLGGFGLTLRALESRFDRLGLTSYHGLYEQSPALAVCFLVTGLACVGFPFTLGFVSTELLVDGTIEASIYVGLGVAAAAALNSIAVVRAYFLLFTGGRHASTVFLGIGVRERIAVLTLTALILGGGLFPQPGVASRYRAAEAILRTRRAYALSPESPTTQQAASGEGGPPAPVE